MLFRRLILCAVAIGVVAGVLLGIGEQFTTAPLIHAAEQYEHPAAAAAGHHHEAAAWQPSDGTERTTFTIIAAVCEAIGYAALLLVAMSAARVLHGTRLSPVKSLAWGVAAFLTVYLVPSFGLAPEVPGTNAAALGDRQIWWISTALLTAAVLWVLAYGPSMIKWISPVLLIVPFVYGAPEPAGSPYAGHGAAEIQALEAIHSQFVYATAGTNLLLWLVLGALCAWAARGWIVPLLAVADTDGAPARA